jgi:membrane protease subunit (stomatin/prohibitin family)
VAIVAPKASGISKVRETIKARVTDKAAFLQAVAANPQYLDLVEVNQSALNALAKALGTSLKIAGIETYADKTISARSF